MSRRLGQKHLETCFFISCFFICLFVVIGFFYYGLVYIFLWLLKIIELIKDCRIKRLQDQ